MSIFKRIVQSIINLKKRTIILSILFIVVSVFLISGAAIQNSLKKVMNETKNQVNPIISVELDLDALMKEMYGGESSNNKQNIDEKLVEKISNSPYVKDFSVYSDAAVSTQFSSAETTNVPDQAPKGYTTPTNDLSIFDSTNPDLAKTEIKVVEGKLPDDSDLENPIMVSEKYAKEYNLNVGDSLKLDLNSGFQEDKIKKEMNAKVSGIYTLTEDNDPVYLKKEKETFYSTRKLLDDVKKIQTQDEEINSPIMHYEKVKVELKNPMDTDKFISEIKSVGGDFSSIKFNSTYEQYKTISNMIDKIMNIFSVLQLVIFAVAAVIVSLIMLLSLRERKYEIGLLLALGETKFKILLQMFLEVMTVLAISFMIGFGISNFIVNPIATETINQEMQQTISDNKQEPMVQRGPNYVEDTSVKLGTEIQIQKQDKVQNMRVAGFIFLILLVIILCSTTIPTMSILKKSPKSILSSTE